MIPLWSLGVPRKVNPGSATYTFDLAVNPLSLIMLKVMPLNSTGTLANYGDIFDIFSQAMTGIRVLFRGEMIKQFTGADLMAYNWHRWGILPWEVNGDDTNADRRYINIPLMFGKNAYDPKSLFPATHRGELQLQVDFVGSGTGYSSCDFGVDFLEILDAKPDEYEKHVTQNITYNATGQQDVDFAIGNVYRNILCFGTTSATGATPAATLGTLKCLLANVEKHYTAIDFETANMISCLWGRQAPLFRHQHRTDTAGAVTGQNNFNYRVSAIGEGTSTPATGFLAQYAWLDFDPTKDDTYSLDTAQSNRFHVRATVGTANAARFIPCEVIKTPGGSPY